jgi:hypothetical protein
MQVTSNSKRTTITYYLYYNYSYNNYVVVNVEGNEFFKNVCLNM